MRATISILAVLFVPAIAGSASDAQAQTGCTKTIVDRAVPGGWAHPAVKFECDEAENPLLNSSAADLCTADRPRSLPPGYAEGCERAVSGAQDALRKVKIRSAIRAGDADDEIASRYGVSDEAVAKIRSSEFIAVHVGGFSADPATP
jgi:hypothetical protein